MRDINNRWLCVELPVTEYREAWDLQGDLVAARKEKVIDTNLVLIVEHPPVFTLGRRGGLNNLSVSESFLKQAGIPVVQVERGGSITYHGPGQLVAYPVVDLRAARMNVEEYVEHLEEVMIRVAADWGIQAERNPLNRGIWVGNNKLGSIGIAIRKGISFHGMALNVNPSLEPFTWMKPCGLNGIGVTSIEKELSNKVDMSEARERAKRHFEEVFGVELKEIDLAVLQSRLKGII